MTNKLNLLFGGPANASRTVALAHGAGTAMDTPFMEAICKGVAKLNVRVARFEFPYMNKRRADGKKRAPDREPILRETWLDVIAHLGAERLVIGGKSMGGRIASLVADEAKVAGLVCLGYPFHPTGKPDKLRVDHLRSLKTPTLILQGERDAFGNREEVSTYDLADSVQIHWLPGGDHSFKPRKSSGLSEQENWDEAITAIAKFIDSCS